MALINGMEDASRGDNLGGRGWDNRGLKFPVTSASPFTSCPFPSLYPSAVRCRPRHICLAWMEGVWVPLRCTLAADT